MGTKHVHYDVIVAWAAGEEIEIKDDDGVWVSFTNAKHVIFYEDMEYRTKPKIVKKEGWVNVYKATERYHIGMACVSNAYATKEEALADRRINPEPTDTIRIEWEETVE